MLMKKYDTKTLLIKISKRQDGIVNIHSLHDFMRFLFQKLSAEKITDQYNISFDLNEEGVEKTVSFNRSLFSMGPRRDVLYVNKDTEEYKDDNDDDIIDSIIDDYFYD